MSGLARLIISVFPFLMFFGCVSKKTQGRRKILPAQQYFPNSRVLRWPDSEEHPINSLP